MWETAVRETLALCDALGQLYKKCDSTKFNPESIVIDWGDGVLFNRDRVWQEYKEMVQSGMLKPEIAIAWYFNLPMPKTPADLQNIREQYMPEMEDLTKGTGDE